MMFVGLLLVLNFSIGVSASRGYYRQEADACITISQRLSVKGGSDFYVTPGGTAIPKESYHSMSNVDVRKWYLSQEAKIPDLIDASQSLENQAYQAFSLRNEFRTTARELMADRATAESLYITDPNRTWEQMVNKQINNGLIGDDIYRAIINSSQKSRPSVNKSLGLE